MTLSGPRTPLPEVTVDELVARQIERQADRIAVVAGADRLTYADVGTRARALAERLRALGVGRDTPVAVLGTRSPDLVVAVVAVLAAGAAFVPLDPTHPTARLRAMVADAKVRLVVATGSSTTPPAMTTLPDDFQRVEEFDGYTLARTEAGPEPPTPGHRSALDAAYVLFTSGSTGRPKGVVVHHRAVVNAWYAWRDRYRLDHTRHYLQLASHTFDVFAGDVVRAFCSGGRLLLVPDETVLEAAGLYDLMRRERPDYAELVPAIAHGLLDHVEAVGGDLAFLRTVVLGADVWLVRDHRRLRRLTGPDAQVVNSYGVTEATVDSAVYDGPVDGMPDDAPAPVGHPWPNTTIHLLDDELRPVRPGEPGHLCLAGLGLARGYAYRSELTASRFVASPFGPPGARVYLTGDRARQLPDGALVLLGRVDRQLKVRGIRIEPEEVEGALAAGAGVRRAVVIGPASDSPAGLSAYVVAEPGAHVDLPALRAHARRMLPEPACPTRWAVLDSLPLTSNGKVDTAALGTVPTRPANRLSPDDQASDGSADGVEGQVAAIWSELLGVEPVGANDHFFELGGTSILLARLVAVIRSRMSVELPLRELFDEPTVAVTAALVRSADKMPTAEPALRPRARRRASLPGGDQ